MTFHRRARSKAPQEITLHPLERSGNPEHELENLRALAAAVEVLGHSCRARRTDYGTWRWTEPNVDLSRVFEAFEALPHYTT